VRGSLPPIPPSNHVQEGDEVAAHGGGELLSQPKIQQYKLHLLLPPTAGRAAAAVGGSGVGGAVSVLAAVRILRAATAPEKGSLCVSNWASCGLS